MSGFIAMYRQAFLHPILKDGDRFRAWFWLVANAAWKDTQHDARGRTIEVKRGQICIGREHLAKEWNWSPSSVERFLTRLETEHMIERETGHGKSVITICNYEKYQEVPSETGHLSGQQIGQKPDRNRTAKEQGNKETIIYVANDADEPSPAKPISPNLKNTDRKHVIPVDWKPAEFGPASKCREVIANWSDGEIKTQIEHFTKHHRSKGSRFVSWQDAWETWVLNSRNFRTVKTPASRSTQPDPDQGFLAHMMASKTAARSP